MIKKYQSEAQCSGGNNKMLGLLEGFLAGLGAFTIIMLIIIILLIPFICAIILGTYFATALGLTGLVWWAFVIIFYLIIAGILGALA